MIDDFQFFIDVDAVCLLYLHCYQFTNKASSTVLVVYVNNKTMIHTNPSPKMTLTEVENFRHNVHKYVSMNFTPEEKKAIQKRKERISSTAQRVLNNNGGKNPILGY